MTNAMVPVTTLPGIVEDNEGAELVDGYIALITKERGPDALPRLPSDRERKEIARRLERLTAKLRPASMTKTQQDDIVQALGSLWLRYPSLRNADIGEMTTGYLLDLERFPKFAVIAAIDDVRFNRIKGLDPDWPPTSPRISAAVERHVEPIAIERSKAARVLAVRNIVVPVSEEMRKRVGKTFTELAEATKLRLEEDHEERRARHATTRSGPFGREMLLAEYRHLGVAPVMTSGKKAYPISASLAKQLGVLPTKPSTPDDERFR